MIGGSMKKIAKLFGVLIGTAFLVFVLDIGCIFRTLTGFPCMGCGVTRAFLAFLQGHVVDAFYYHPLFWLTGILIVLALWKDAWFFVLQKLTGGFGSLYYWYTFLCILYGWCSCSRIPPLWIIIMRHRPIICINIFWNCSPNHHKGRE